MDWKTMLAYITGSVDEDLLLRNEYLAAENRLVELGLGKKLLQASVFLLAGLEAFDLVGADAAVLLTPAVVGRLDDAGLAARVWDRQAA